MSVILLLLLGGPDTDAGARTRRAEAYYAFMVATQAVEDDDYATALDAFRKAHSLDPDDPTILLELAEVHARLRRFKEAVQWARRASDKDPEAEEPWMLLARLSTRLGNTRDAIAALERLVALRPQEPAHRLSLSKAVRDTGDQERAAQILMEGFEENPSSGELASALADLYVSRGRLDMAMQTLERCLQSAPEDYRLRALLAQFYLRTNNDGAAREALLQIGNSPDVDLPMLLRVAEALGDDPLNDAAAAASIYRRAVRLAPGEPSLRLMLAATLDDAGAIVKAREAYKESLEMLPADDERRVVVLAQIGRIELDLGRTAAAVETLRQAEELSTPENLEVTLLLASALEDLGDLEGALRATEHLLDARPIEREDNRPLWVARSAYLALNGRAEEALGIFRRLEAAEPLQLRGRVSLLQALMRAGSHAEAASLRAQIVAGDPSRERALVLALSGWLAQAGQMETARRELESLLQRYPRDLGLYLALARMHQGEQDHESSLSVLQRAVALYPDDADLRFQLGASYERLGNFAEAERELERAIELNPEHAQALNYLGYTYADRGVRLERSVELIKRALARDADNGAFLDSLGWAYYKLDELELAERHLNRALNHLDQDPTIYDHLGDVYRKMGRIDEALAAYEKGVSLADDATAADPIAAKVRSLREELEAATETPQLP